MNELQEQYEHLLNSIQFVDSSSYFSFENTGFFKKERKIYSIKEMVDFMFSQIDSRNRLYVRINTRLKNGEYESDWDEEFTEDTFQNRIKFLNILTVKKIPLGILLIFSEIGHCSKTKKIKDYLFFRGHVADKILYDYELIDLLRDKSSIKNKCLSEEQFAKLLSEKREERMNTFYFKRSNLE